MRARFILLIVFVLSLAAGVLPAAAQESMTHVCDSTLITLLYIAEHDYGFHSMMDVSSFEKGQYAPLFDAMMADMMTTEETMMEDDMMATEETMMEGDTMMEGMTMLVPGAVADEDPACTALREELDAFFYQHFSDAMMMDEGM